MILNEGVSLTPAEYANWEILEAWIKLQSFNMSVDFQLYYFKEVRGEGKIYHIINAIMCNLPSI